MRLWLDDVRSPPGDNTEWIWVKTSGGAISAISEDFIELVSLDHDLGVDDDDGQKVLDWLEERVMTNTCYFDVPEIRIHSANPVARKIMETTAERIRRGYNND